jgi:cytochrome c556
MIKIHALFSLANEYDQPPHNLVCFWPGKPALDEVAKALDREFPASSDQETLALVKIWQGEETLAPWEDVKFWLEEVESHTPLVVNSIATRVAKPKKKKAKR